MFSSHSNFDSFCLIKSVSLNNKIFQLGETKLNFRRTGQLACFVFLKTKQKYLKPSV